jgi:hypothetical protein
MRRNVLESGADRGMRAYVTGGWLRQLRRARRSDAACYGLDATSCRRARGSRHTSDAKASRCMHRLSAAFLGVGLGEGTRRRRCSADAAAAQVATLTAAGGATLPSLRRGARLRASHPRTDTAPLPLLLRLHRTWAIPRRARKPLRRLRTLQASATEGTDNVAWSLWKNPALASTTKHRATPRGVSSDRPS